MALNFSDEVARVRGVMARLPKVFGLRAYPGQRFVISEAASLFCGEGLVYVAREAGGPLFKGTETELRAALEESRQPEQS